MNGAGFEMSGRISTKITLWLLGYPHPLRGLAPTFNQRTI